MDNLKFVDKIKEVFMKKLLAMMALSVGLMVNAQTVDLLKPSKEIALRAPSVPIVVSDPYFSIWSPYDNLMEGSTEHWTNAKKPLLGALRVDGKVYRFLGKDKINLIPIAPMDGKSCNLMIATGRKAKLLSVAVTCNAFIQNGKVIIPTFIFAAHLISMIRI